MFLLAPTVVSVASSRGRRGALRAFAIALACAVGVCVPVLARHLALGHGWILNTYSLGFNAYEIKFDRARFLGTVKDLLARKSAITVIGGELPHA